MSETIADAYVMEEQVGFLLRLAMQRHTSIFTELMIAEVTQTQFAALVKLLECGPRSQADLARMICLDANTLKGVIDRLRARRLVTIEVDVEDRRRTIIELTKLGRRITEASLTDAREITAKTLAPLTAPEQRQFLKLLKKLG